MGDCAGGREMAQIQGATLLDADTVAPAKWEPRPGPGETD